MECSERAERVACARKLFKTLFQRGISLKGKSARRVRANNRLCATLDVARCLARENEGSELETVTTTFLIFTRQSARPNRVQLAKSSRDSLHDVAALLISFAESAYLD